MAEVFRRWGVLVRLDPEGDNLVRSLRPEERTGVTEVAVRAGPVMVGSPLEPDPVWIAALAAASGEAPMRLGPAAPYLVEAEGMPNLAHEFAHVLLAGIVADDHGIDYTRIPLDVSDPADRQLLWDELACSWWSCGVVGRALQRAADPRGDVEASGEGAGLGGVDPMVAAWFAEQVEIQPVFYGDDDDAKGRRRFVERVDEWLARDGATMAATCARLDRVASEHLRATLPPGATELRWFQPLLAEDASSGTVSGRGGAVAFPRLWGHYTSTFRRALHAPIAAVP